MNESDLGKNDLSKSCLPGEAHKKGACENHAF